MAAVTVAFDGTRTDNADSLANWTNEGATATVETDYYYQGSASISAQVKTAEVGFYHTAVATANYTTGNFVWIAKIIQTNKDAIDGNGLQLKIGSANSAAYLYGIFDSNTYPTVGGWQVVCINPNITQWRTSTIGSPDLTAVDTYGIRSDAAFTAKAPNLGMDAVDYVTTGTGLTLTRGDGADANGTMNSFVTFDEGTQGNRYGVVQTRGGIIFINGTIQIGNSTVNTEFTDSNRVLVFPDHRVANGFCGIKANISNTGSGVSMTSFIFNGRGALYTNDDTRPEYIVTGNSGSLSISGSTFNVFRQMNLTSTCTLDSCSLIAGQQIVQNSANIYSCDISSAATTNNAAFIISDNVSRISECNFTQSANGGHALQLTTPGTYTMLNNFFNYGANGTGNAAIYNNSGGLVTLNLSGGTTPTVLNGTSATTNIVSSATITVYGIKTESEIEFVDTSLNVIVAGNESTNGFIQSATVVNGGTGYSNSDTLTVSGGTGTAGTLSIVTDGSGTITAVSVASNGQYSADPINPVSTTGGSGAGASFNLVISGEFSYAYGGTPTYDIVVFHIDYKDLRFVDYTLPSTNSTLLVSQIPDRVYLNP